MFLILASRYDFTTSNENCLKSELKFNFSSPSLAQLDVNKFLEVVQTEINEGVSHRRATLNEQPYIK